MAGLFGFFDYTKEGPGVAPDEPDKGPFYSTLEILVRKFWDLVKLNLMMVLMHLPALIGAFITVLYLLTLLFPTWSVESIAAALEASGIATAAGQLESVAATQLTLIYFVLAFTLVGTSLFVMGPFQAGFSYILRSMIRDEHVFVWADFFAQTRSNWKQGLFASLTSMGVSIVLIVNLAFYRNSTIGLPSLGRSVLTVLMLMLWLAWLLIQHYVYPMLVTFNLRLPQIYRNSALLVILCLPQNLLLIALLLIINGVIPVIFLTVGGVGTGILLSAIWYLLFALSLSQFLSMAIVWRGLERYLIKK